MSITKDLKKIVYDGQNFELKLLDIKNIRQC